MEIYFHLHNLANLDVKSNALVDHSEYEDYIKHLNSKQLESHIETIFNDDLPDEIYSLKYL